MRRGTYSIVARDAVTGELGVAVQSHWFSVGSIVSWAEPGAGAVATQSIAEPAYGPRLLDRLRGGQAPREALDELLAADQQAGFRQVAVVDSEGAEGALAHRLLAALDAGEAAGGDVRGRQSAALVVVPAEGERWHRVVELRVEDHPEPLEELRRLLDLADAYALATEGDELVGKGRHAEAAERYHQASELATDSQELLFWAGLSLAQGGAVEEGAAKVRRAIDLHEGWRDLLARLDPEIAPGAEPVREALGIARD